MSPGPSRGGLPTSSYQTVAPPSSDKSVSGWLRNTVILRPRSGARLLFLCCEGNAPCPPSWARKDNLPQVPSTAFHALRRLKNKHRKPDDSPYPRKLPEVLRTHQVDLGREKAERWEERVPGWPNGPEGGNFHALLWLCCFHCRSRTGPRLQVNSAHTAQIGAWGHPSPTSLLVPPTIRSQKVSVPVSK